MLPPTHIEGPSTQVEVPPLVIKEVLQPPKNEVALRRYTRERRSTFSDDYVVYIQEHEFHKGKKSDPISFHQVK